VIHVEMHQGETFCEQAVHPVSVRAIEQSAWHDAPEAVQQATCERCLLRLFMLGDSAKIAFARMGRRVEVRDVSTAAPVTRPAPPC
jgi:hypothetical protein